MNNICDKLRNDNGKSLRFKVFDDGFDRIVFFEASNEIVVNGIPIIKPEHLEMVWVEYFKLKQRKSKRTVPDGYKMKGFTLIELMIVIVIVAILASVAIPACTSYNINSDVVQTTCPDGVTTALTPQGEEILVCRKTQAMKQTVKFSD